MRIKLVIEHSGPEFAGWQFQPGQCTVQGELENALTVYLGSLAKENGQKPSERIVVSGSGRTDSGVHARAQVASFDWPDELRFNANELLRAVNGITPPALVVRSVEQVADSFDARRSPHIKCYRYTFLLRHEYGGVFDNRAWSVSDKLNIPAMAAAARLFEGRHDFSAFRAADCASASTVRHILRCELSRISDLELVLTIIGNGFLKQMVRIIAGTVLEVGKGERDLASVAKLLQAGARVNAGPTAPAHGLTLEWVRYHDGV